VFEAAIFLCEINFREFSHGLMIRYILVCDANIENKESCEIAPTFNMISGLLSSECRWRCRMGEQTCIQLTPLAYLYAAFVKKAIFCVPY
jgi:hypothetical protein